MVLVSMPPRLSKRFIALFPDSPSSAQNARPVSEAASKTVIAGKSLISARKP